MKRMLAVLVLVWGVGASLSAADRVRAIDEPSVKTLLQTLLESKDFDFRSRSPSKPQAKVFDGQPKVTQALKAQCRLAPTFGKALVLVAQFERDCIAAAYEEKKGAWVPKAFRAFPAPDAKVGMAIRDVTEDGSKEVLLRVTYKPEKDYERTEAYVLKWNGQTLKTALHVPLSEFRTVMDRKGESQLRTSASLTFAPALDGTAWATVVRETTHTTTDPKTGEIHFAKREKPVVEQYFWHPLEVKFKNRIPPKEKPATHERPMGPKKDFEPYKVEETHVHPDEKKRRDTEAKNKPDEADAGGK